MFVEAVLAVGLFLFVARTALPRALGWVARTRIPELFPLVALVAAFGMALVATRGGLSLPVGTFLAGLALSGSPYGHQMFAEVLPLRDAFVAVFFTSVGLLVDPAAAAAEPQLLGLMIAMMVLKGLLVGALVHAVWRSARLGVVVGLALAQIGEFSFVLSRAGVQQGLLLPSHEQAFLGAAILTMAATPLLVRGGRALADSWGGAVCPHGSGNVRSYARDWPWGHRPSRVASAPKHRNAISGCRLRHRRGGCRPARWNPDHFRRCITTCRS